MNKATTVIAIATKGSTRSRAGPIPKSISWKRSVSYHCHFYQLPRNLGSASLMEWRGGRVRLVAVSTRPRSEGTPFPLRLPTFATVRFVWRRGEGFEPPTQLPVYRTEARCLRPLSHLSATAGGFTTKDTRLSQNPKTPRWCPYRRWKKVPAALGDRPGLKLAGPIDAKSAVC
jgi:hypothetical protein